VWKPEHRRAAAGTNPCREAAKGGERSVMVREWEAEPSPDGSHHAQGRAKRGSSLDALDYAAGKKIEGPDVQDRDRASHFLHRARRLSYSLDCLQSSDAGAPN